MCFVIDPHSRLLAISEPRPGWAEAYFRWGVPKVRTGVPNQGGRKQIIDGEAQGNSKKFDNTKYISNLNFLSP